MLPFIQDDQTPDRGSAAESRPAATSPANADEQISSDSDYLLPAEHGKNARQSTIILVVLFVLGGLVVWFMVKKVGPKAIFAAGPSPAEERLEQYVDLVSGMEAEFNTAVDDLMGRFDQFSNIEQVGVAELTKNPFRSDLAVLPEVQPDTSRAKAREEAKRRAERLQLWSIMASPQGSCCMINEKIVHVGDVIDGFTVVGIEERFVDLTLNGFTFRLQVME